MDIEEIIAAAQRHGSQSDPDMEVGDLQELARDLWASMTPEQQDGFTGRVIDWEDFIKQWLPEGGANGQGQHLRNRRAKQRKDDHR